MFNRKKRQSHTRPAPSRPRPHPRQRNTFSPPAAARDLGATLAAGMAAHTHHAQFHDPTAAARRCSKQFDTRCWLALYDRPAH
eukprot:1115500-Prymnesium_polylepis.1